MSGGSIAYGSSYLGDGKVGISKQVFSVINSDFLYIVGNTEITAVDKNNNDKTNQTGLKIKNLSVKKISIRIT